MRHVLVVDDNRDLADSVALLLEDEGFVTRVSYSAEEAWAEAKRSPPEIVILDIRMPGIGGLQLARALRAAATLPVLLIAFTGSMLAAELASVGSEFDAVIRKPASLDDIIVAIQNAGRGARMRALVGDALDPEPALIAKQWPRRRPG